MPAKGPHNRKSIAKAVWVAKAVRLSNEGHSIRSIARAVGKSATTVWDVLQEEFARVRAPAEEVEMLRNVQRAQIARQLQAWIPRSIKSDKDGAGNHHAALVVSRFLERAAKLDGLDAPTKAEHSGPDGAAIVFDLSGVTDEQIRNLRAAVAADDAADEGGAAGGAGCGGGSPGSGDGEPA